MKHLLFIVTFVVSFNAFASYSPADCREALRAQVWNEQKFTRIGRLDGALDGAYEASLLVRVPRENAVIDVTVDDANITAYPEQTFSRDGYTYGLIHGSARDLINRRRDLARINGGRGVGFQVLRAEQATELKPRLGLELERRLPLLKVAKTPFVKTDRWLERFATYRRLKRGMAIYTAGLRDGTAARLHRWRNPPVEVSEFVRREVQACTGPSCRVKPDFVDQVETEFAMLSHRLGSDLKLDQAGSLEAFTLDLMTVAKPTDVDQHDASLRGASLAAWNPVEMTRHQRLVLLERALTLVERAAWGLGAGSAPLTPENLRGRLARLEAEMAQRLPARQMTVAEWTQGAAARELFDPRFATLRERRPYVVVSDERDLRVVAVEAGWLYRQDNADLKAELEEAAGRPLGLAGLATFTDGLENRISVRPVAEVLDARVLREIAERQEVTFISSAEPRTDIILIPMALEPEVHYDTAVLGSGLRSMAALSTFVLSNLDRARRGPAGLQLDHVDDAGQRRIIDFEYVPRPYGRDQVTLNAARRVTFSEEGLTTSLEPKDQVQALILGNLDTALRLGDGRRQLIFVDPAGRSLRFEFSHVVEAKGREHVTINGVREVQEERVRLFWKAFAKQNGIEDVEERVSRPFNFGLEPVYRIAVSSHVAARLFAYHGLTPARLSRLLTEASGASVAPATRCARHDGFEICFGPQGYNWARLKDVRPASTSDVEDGE